MTTATHPPLVVPAGTLKAADFFIDLGKGKFLSNGEWLAVRNWLLATPFDNGNFLAGEAALALIRDHATPKLRREIADALAQSELLPRLKALLPEVAQGPRVQD